MTSFRRLAIPLIALTLALAGGATAWLITGAAAAVPSPKATSPGEQPNESNLIIESQVDTNFCLDNTPAPSQPASQASMSQCSLGEPSQQWMFADDADGSVVIIGNTGQCLGLPAKVGSFVSVTPCTFQGVEKFFFTPAGQIESTNGRKCLEAAQAKQDALVFTDTCQTSVKDQFWRLAH